MEDKPKHKFKGGEKKGWTRAEFDDSFLVDDDWIKNNTKEVKDEWDGQETPFSELPSEPESQ